MPFFYELVNLGLGQNRSNREHIAPDGTGVGSRDNETKSGGLDSMRILDGLFRTSLYLGKQRNDNSLSWRIL